MQTERTTPTRLAKRAAYDLETIYQILDEGMVCQVAYVHENTPFIIPTAYCRVGNTIYIHSSVGSFYGRELAKGIPLCFSVTHLDGLVLARSAFHHSVNYRSVVLFGSATVVTDPEEALLALERFTEHLIPGRWNDIRWPNESEMKKTLVLSIPIEEASAKVRVGGPKDDEEDYALDCWAGVIPLKTVAAPPISDELLREGIPVPAYASEYPSRNV
jgi:uncharacterized protein